MQLEEQGRLDRIIVDEAHLVRTASEHLPSLPLVADLGQRECSFLLQPLLQAEVRCGGLRACATGGLENCLKRVLYRLLEHKVFRSFIS